MVNVSGLVIEDTWFVDSAKFSVRPQFCRGVRIRNVVVDNPAGSRGTNGIVVDSCQVRLLGRTQAAAREECTLRPGVEVDRAAAGWRMNAVGGIAMLPHRLPPGPTFRSCFLVETYMRTTYSHPAAASTLSVQDVEVTDCVVSTGFKEDAICVKSGEGEYGIALNAPSRCGRGALSCFQWQCERAGQWV